MSEQQSGLVVSPLSLYFEFIPNQPLSAQISLQNPTKDRVAFSVSTNRPTLYQIKTQTGYVDPGETFKVDIHMHASSEPPNNINMDKFTVQFVAVAKGESLIMPKMFTRVLHPIEKVEVGVLFEDQDETKVEQSSQSCLELLKDQPRSSQEDRRTLFTNNFRSNEGAQNQPTIFQQANQAELQNKEKNIEIGKRHIEMTYKGGQAPAKIRNQQSHTEITSFESGEFVNIPIQQDDIQFRGDSSETLTVNKQNQNDVENAVKSENRRIDIQDTIRERVKSSSDFFTDVLQKDLTSGRVFLTFPLDLLFPRAIRTYSAQICQILLGIIIFIGGFTYFWWLFMQFNKCDTQVREVPGIPDNAIECEPRFIDKTAQIAFSIDGKWEGDLNYTARNAGPWRFYFDSYQADNKTFLKNIKSLVKKSQNFTSSLKNKTFIETLGAALFFSEKEYGINGTVELTANIDLEMVFDNYKYTKFSFIDLKKDLLENVKQNQGARIGDAQQLPVQNCQGEIIRTGNKTYYCHRLIDEGAPEITTDMGDLTYAAPPVKYSDVFKEKFFPNPKKYSRWANKIRGALSMSSSRSVGDVLAYPEEPFISKFNIQEAFVYNYCNNDGKKYCREAMQKVLEQDGVDDFFYTWIPGFWGELGSNIKELSQLVFRYGVAKFEIYINSLDMFGIYLGQKQVLPEKGGPNTVYALVMVPQLVQFDFQNGEMVCRSCYEPVPLLNTTNCQKNIYVILHLYAFPMSDYFKNYSQQNLTAQETIQQFYVTSFIHGLESWLRSNRNARIFRDDASTPDSSDFQNYNFFFNKKFASVNDLHCEGSSQWAFKQDIKFEIPFLLETGINSCVIENCPGWLRALANAWANLELAYLIVILIISIVILLVIFKMQGDSEEGVVSCRDTLTAFIDKIMNS